MPSQYLVTVRRRDFDEWLGADRSATIYPTQEYALLHRTILKSLRRMDQVKFQTIAEFHASTDKSLIDSERPKNAWALLKNRNIHFFNHEFAPHEAWVDADDVRARAARKGLVGDQWLSRFPRLVFRDIARNDDERTLIACLAPPGAVSTYDTPMFLPECNAELYPSWAAFYGAAFSAYVFDFLIRPFVDKHIKGYTLARIPWPSPACIAGNGIELDWLVRRVVQLTYTRAEFRPFAEDCGFPGPPLSLDEDRRFLIRCELDALFFWLCLPSDEVGQWRLSDDEAAHEQARLRATFTTPREAVAYILETFPIVRRKEQEKWGEPRTRQVVLGIYDALLEAGRAGKSFRSAIEPTPAEPRVSVQPAFKRAVLAAEIVHRLHAQAAFGRTMHQKALQIGEAWAGVAEVAGTYQRHAAGPHDYAMMLSVERILAQNKWYETVQERGGGRVYYRPFDKAGEHRRYYERYFSPEQRAAVDRLIGWLEKMDTERAEIVSTLLAAWNDLLLDGAAVTDDRIIREARENWTPDKLRIPEDRWRRALVWMKEKGLIPRGVGRKTVRRQATASRED
jgi:hypothetical protein